MIESSKRRSCFLWHLKYIGQIFRADFHENLQQKLTRLMKTAGMGEIDFDNKFVAIKNALWRAG